MPLPLVLSPIQGRISEVLGKPFGFLKTILFKTKERYKDLMQKAITVCSFRAKWAHFTQEAGVPDGPLWSCE
jgi:hypothetical protein